MAILTESLILDVGAIFFVLLTFVYFFFTRHFNHWTKKGVPTLQPTPFVGNFKEIIFAKKCIGEHLLDIYLQTKGKPYVGIFAFDRPIFLVRDLELVKHILVKDFHYFADRIFNPDERNDPLVAKSLFGMGGPKWKHLRTKLTPTFTSGKMKIMSELVNECGKDLASYMEESARLTGEVEVKDAMARYTTDVIATCIFGIQGNSLKNPEADFRRVLRKIFEFSVFKSIKMTAAFFAPKLISTFNLTIFDSEISEFIRSTIWSTVEYREKNGVVRKDFLDLLMQIRSKGNLDEEGAPTNNMAAKYPLDGDDFVAQAFVFLAAGFETSSTTMSFALYELALQPELQDRLRDEIRAVLERSDHAVTYEGIQEMTYLDMVVAETLRKYPILPFLDRQTLQDYKIPGSDIVLEKGIGLMIPVLAIQRDPEFYPEPDRFDPERFTEENKQKRPSFTYMPFGEGPRICIGSRMGLMQVKVGLVHMLSQFEVQPCKDTSIPLVLDPKSFLLNPMGGLTLALKKLY